MDALWSYDERGQPQDTKLAEKFADQKDYITAVRQEEKISRGNENCLWFFKARRSH